MVMYCIGLLSGNSFILHLLVEVTLYIHFRWLSSWHRRCEPRRTKWSWRILMAYVAENDLPVELELW